MATCSPLTTYRACSLSARERGQFAVRRLYTDDEEVLFRAARPIVLNGIEDVIGRADLADRAIFLTLARPSQLDPEIANFWRREDENASPIKG
jgi:hypothetical protein